MKYYIEDIRITKDGSRLHATLVDEKGELCICATLDYVIQACIDRKYEVVNLETNEFRNTIKFVGKQ